MKYMISWFERTQGSPVEYENAQKRILEVFTQWKAPDNFKIELFVVRVGEWGGHILVDCDDPLAIHKFCSTWPAFEMQARPVPWYWLAAIHLQETRLGRIEGVSSAGAVGPMQFLPTTWEECCVGDPTDTHDAIVGAATYLASNGAPGDLTTAVRRYNPNDAYIASVLAYASNMAADERAYLGYHGWQVFVGSVAGSLRLPVGYAATERVDAAAYVAAHPEDRVG